MKRQASSLFAIWILIGATSAPTSTTSKDGRILTEKESLDVVFLSPANDREWGLYRHANPAALPVLRKIVADPTLLNYHPAAWIELGYVGDATDLRVLKEMFHATPSRALTPPEERTLAAALECLGVLYKRDIVGTKELFAELLKSDYWSQCGLKWPGAVDQLGFEPSYLLFSMAAEGYSMSGKTDLDAAIKEVVDGVTDAKAKEYVAWRTSPERLALHRQLLGEAAFAPAALADAAGKWNGNSDRPGPSIPSQPKDMKTDSTAISIEIAPVEKERADGKEAVAAMKEATAEFDEIKRTLIDGDHEKILALPVIYEGKPLDPKTLPPRTYDLAVSKLPKEQGILGSDAGRNSQPDKIKIEYQTVFQMDPGGSHVSAGEILIATRELPGTATVGKRIFPNRPSPLTQTEDGTLVVVMEKRGGTWYWHPFGW